MDIELWAQKVITTALMRTKKYNKLRAHLVSSDTIAYIKEKAKAEAFDEALELVGKKGEVPNPHQEQVQILRARRAPIREASNESRSR